jgi:hypothetical protein
VAKGITRADRDFLRRMEARRQKRRTDEDAYLEAICRAEYNMGRDRGLADASDLRSAVRNLLALIDADVPVRGHLAVAAVRRLVSTEPQVEAHELPHQLCQQCGRPTDYGRPVCHICEQAWAAQDHGLRPAPAAGVRAGADDSGDGAGGGGADNGAACVGT